MKKIETVDLRFTPFFIDLCKIVDDQFSDSVLVQPLVSKKVQAAHELLREGRAPVGRWRSCWPSTSPSSPPSSALEM